MIYVFEGHDKLASIVYDETTLTTEIKEKGIALNALPAPENQTGKMPVLKCEKSTNRVWYDYIDEPKSVANQQISDLQSELLNTKLAMAELVEQQQADKLSNQLALAELIESIMEGGATA